MGQGSRPGGGTPTRHYLPGLDGVRALAVIAVLLFHAGFSWAVGGYLGVEVFFVISGYLITTLLIAERARTGRIDLRAFWARRARRLLPALFAVLILVLVVWLIFLPGEVATIRSDAAAAAVYVANWWFILKHQSYFASFGRPSPFGHLWSLAIEEQFYLIWPPVLLLLYRRLTRRAIGLIAVLGAAVSLALMAVLYAPHEPSYVYFGTDTRASGLLIGAALALLWRRRAPRAGGGRPSGALTRGVGRRLAGQVLGLAGLAFLGYAVVAWAEQRAIVFHGGFGLVDVATAAVVVAAVGQPRGIVARLLEAPLLRWTGVRSYGIYLWHYPVFVLTRPGDDLPVGPWPALAIRLAITLVVAELSFRYLETPIRTGGLRRLWQWLRSGAGLGASRPGAGRRPVTPARVRWLAGTSVTATMAVGLAAIALLAAAARPAGPPSYLAALKSVNGALPPVSHSPTPRGTDPGATAGPTAVPTAPGTPAAVPSRAASARPTAGAEPRRPANRPAGPPKRTATGAPTPTSPAKPTSTSPAKPNPPVVTGGEPGAAAGCRRVSVIGDSVLLGALPDLRADIPQLFWADADEGLQVWDAPAMLRQRVATGDVGCVVVVALGTNGNFTPSYFDDIMKILSGAHAVVFVNDKVARSWTASNNQVIAAGCQRWAKAVCVDWDAVGSAHPEYFYPDHTHLNPAGRRAYARLVAGAVHGLL